MHPDVDGYLLMFGSMLAIGGVVLLAVASVVIVWLYRMRGGMQATQWSYLVPVPLFLTVTGIILIASSSSM